MELNNLNEIRPEFLPDIDSKIYTEIFRRSKTVDHPVTRGQPGFIGCRTSQLIYIIICLIWKPQFSMDNLDQVNKIVSFIIKVFNNVFYIKIPPVIEDLQQYEGLYDFIFGNQPATIQPIILDRDNFDTIMSYPARGNNKIIIAALVQDPSEPPSRDFPDGYVVHYFTIVMSSTRADRENPNNISIISSYGSQCVQIPQQKFDLSLIELKKFVVDLELQRSSNPIALQSVSQFIDRYFLQDGLITRKVEKDELTERKKFETIVPESGKRRELIENILPKRYRVFIYPSYSDIVSQIIQYTSIHPRGGKRSNKRKSNNKRINKRRQTKKRNYKRRTNKRYNKRKF